MQPFKENFLILKKSKVCRIRFGDPCVKLSRGEAQLYCKGSIEEQKNALAVECLNPPTSLQCATKENPLILIMQDSFFLNEADLVNDFSGIRLTYDKLQLALYFVKVVDSVLFEGVTGETEIFNLLGNTLKKLESAERLDILKTHFEIKFLYQQGVLPQDLVLPLF